ncbi:hypothetical protein FVEN_g2140 [Fusarium venenatum]|uniref:Uncharacterized protein n=1 Tax=Fusarium venenatum TaxID=56646 RepID=A0A2L2TE82_9HYPO|nr:uncharacterized protein FVRRES_12553 [Fusarium venenatum]KAG8360040.1 hypothetical protein FVEN_g2140 [Fusarium venenatum]KAH6979163.1 hypothetical protein EDB82DRAFT_477881 [Fusarium venenatum]CEI39862.1 unnamed protein product [Fusarium venenatum]
MTNYASSGTEYPGSVRKFVTKIHRLSEIVYHMYHDFPVLNRVQCEMGLVLFPFNLPSRNFMQSLDEDLSEVSNEMEMFFSQSSHAEHRKLGDDLVQRLESVEFAFEDIHTRVLKLDPVRLNETLVELGEAEDCFNTVLESLLLNED